MNEQAKVPTILVVDDAPENLDVMKGILGSEFTVKVATNGKLALKIAEKQSIDLILLDVMMPEMDGFETCRRLKAEEQTRDIPVIFVTAMGETTDEAAGFEIGAADYITKPVNPVTLLARVRTHVILKDSLDSLQEAFATIKAQKDRMQDELNVGQRIQLGMLPESSPDLPEFSVHALMRAAREVGGDFYDYFPVGSGKYAICVADVSDKGVASALFMAITKALIKSRCAEDSSPSSVVTRVNDELAADNDACMFVTLWLAIFDISSGRLTYTNAGHNPPYLLHASGDLECLKARHGPVIGAAEGLAFGEDSLSLQRNDRIVLFTDGVTEAMNVNGDLYGEPRLEKTLGAQSFETLPALVDSVLDDIEVFVGNAEQSDDITILALSYDVEPIVEAEKELRLTMKNTVESIAGLTEDFEAFAEQHGVPHADMMRVNLVFDELLTNVVSYGYQDEEAHEIFVTVRLARGRMVVTIEDDGMPFNPFAREKPDTSLSIEEREIGGLGIYLVKEVMDDCKYLRSKNSNIVTLTKHLH